MRTIPNTHDLHYDETNAVEILHYLGKRLKIANKCCCASCLKWVDQTFIDLPLSDIDLAIKFIESPISFQFKALFENWPISKINEELCQNV